MAFILIPVMTVVAYLLGSLSAAIIVSRYFGMDDPRTYGSGNPGASNVLRSGKKNVAALTLLGDALKGLLAVLLALCLQRMFDLGDGIVAMAALGAVIGHMYPLFFHFKGGKGVATALGVMLGMSFWTTVWVVAIWGMIALKFKKSSLAAVIAAVCAPFISFIIQSHHPKLSWALFAIALMVLCRHKDNMKRLCSGNEPEFGESARPLQGVAQSGFNTVKSDNEVLDEAIQKEIEQAEELIQEVEQDTKEGIENTVETAKDAVESTVEKAKETVEQTVEQVKETVESAKENIENAVEKAQDYAAQTAESAKEKVEQAVEEAVDKVKETSKRVKETAKDVAEEAVQNVKADVETAKSEIKKSTRKKKS